MVDRIPHLLSRVGLVAAWMFGSVVADAAAQGTDGLIDLPKLLGEAQELQGRQRYVDALIKLEEIEKRFPESADLHNIRGSIQLAPSLRDFAAAEASFQKAASLAPGSLAPQFNLAELLFVKHDWAGAKQGFEALSDAFPQLPMAVRHLAVFKRVVCLLKLEDFSGAETLLAEHFTFMDDTPAYYMAKAAVAFQKQDEAGAQEWLDKARIIFGEKRVASYLDCLMEARWVPNIGLPPVSGDFKK